MKTIKTILILCVALCFVPSCKKDVDMTLVQKNVLENADIRQIEVSDAWEVTVVADSNTYVELEYSAYLEEHLSAAMDNNKLRISFKGSVYPEMGSVYRATVHTAHFHSIEALEASVVDFEGAFYSDFDTLNIVLKDASQCNGLHISGKYNYISLEDASTFAEFQVEGTNNSVTVKDASVCKGSFDTRFHFVASLSDQAQLVTFDGTAPYGMIKLQNDCILNMAQTEIEEMQVDLSGASVATVHVTHQMAGTLTEASTLYYKGHAEMEVNCSEDSQLIPL